MPSAGRGSAVFLTCPRQSVKLSRGWKVVCPAISPSFHPPVEARVMRSISTSLRPSPSVAVEELEARWLFAAPRVTSIISDNRGEVLITLDQAVVASTVRGRSVQMHTAGAHGLFGTADDVKVQGRVRWSAGNNRITFKTDQLAANTTYSMKVSA